MKTSWHALHLVLLASAVALGSACGDEGGSDDGDTGSADDGDGGDGDGDGDGDGGDGDGDGGDGGDGGGAACSDACATLVGDPDCAGMGVDAATCESLCTGDACAACLETSDMCGLDCQTACAGGGDDGGGDDGADDGADDGNADSSGGGDDGADDGGVPEVECVNDGECGLSFECVSCNLNDGEGWCVQTSECSFDEDCGSGGACGYNVQSSDYRCLPAENCG